MLVTLWMLQNLGQQIRETRGRRSTGTCPRLQVPCCLRPVSMRGFMEVFLNVTHHLHSLGLRDETPSLNAQFRNTVS